VSSYEKKGGEVIIYFGGGSIGIPEKDIMKIESTETPEKDFTQEGVSVPEAEKSAPSVPSIPAEQPAVSETADRANKLQADLDVINAELKDVEDKESTIKAALEEKASSRQNWNPYQYRYLQQEAEPLQQELSTIQQKKGELLQRKAYIEGELKSLK
jgi:membrane-bound lytic murein transglycosylase B